MERFIPLFISKEQLYRNCYPIRDVYRYAVVNSPEYPGVPLHPKLEFQIVDDGSMINVCFCIGSDVISSASLQLECVMYNNIWCWYDCNVLLAISASARKI